MALFGISVEVPLFLTFVAVMLSGPVYTNLMIYRTCYLSLGYNKTQCALLGTKSNNQTLEKLVEPYAATINMTRNTIESLFSVLLCLFIGSWSDKFGRKPVLTLNLLGGALTYLLVAILSYFPNISPWYSIICSIPILCTGGAATYLTIILSYITDITNEETRGIRMAVFEAVLAGGILIGSVSSSYIFYATNYVWVFIIAAGIYALGLMYTSFFIPESIQSRQTQGIFKEFFQMSNIVDIMKTTFKSREYFTRAIILLNLTILTVNIFAITGEGSVMFFYLRNKFEWTLTKFTLFNSATSVIWIIGIMGGTYILHKLLRIKEMILLLIGTIALIITALLQGLGNTDWYLYAAGSIRCLGGLIGPMSRLLVTKMIPSDEIGKIFSMTMAFEFFVSLGASPLYTAIYNATIKTDPAVFNYITTGLYFFNLLLIVIIIIIQRFDPSNYRQLNEQETSEINENIID